MSSKYRLIVDYPNVKGTSISLVCEVSDRDAWTFAINAGVILSYGFPVKVYKEVTNVDDIRRPLSVVAPTYSLRIKTKLASIIYETCRPDMQSTINACCERLQQLYAIPGMDYVRGYVYETVGNNTKIVWCRDGHSMDVIPPEKANDW